jgi:flavin reductase (DIM6/NTAB) family NADH-FMN oxidoreductase RutF
VPVDWNIYRDSMRLFATGVAVLTVRDGDATHGMTANAFTSVSKNPMLLLVCIQKGSTTHEMISRARSFALNILSKSQRSLAERFAKQTPIPADPFADIKHHRAATDAPILDDCVSYVDCRVIAAHEEGDHTIFIGQVEAAGLGNAQGGLLLWVGGEYRSLEK